MMTRPFRKQRYRWGDNIEMEFKQIRFASVDWIKTTWSEVQWKCLLKTLMPFWVQRVANLIFTS